MKRWIYLMVLVLVCCGCDLLVVDGWDVNPCFDSTCSFWTCVDLYEANAERFPNPGEWFSDFTTEGTENTE